MSYVPVGLPAAQEAQIYDTVLQIREAQKAEQTATRIRTILAVGGALLAAARLGILFAPKIRRRK